MKVLPNLRNCLVLTIAILVVGCASGSSIVIGKKRPSIDSSAVVLYLTPPAHYEVIALISASSKHGWTEQGRTDHAVDELKDQAADLGANGIILQQAGSQSSGGAGVFIPAGNGGGTFVMAS